MGYLAKASNSPHLQPEASHCQPHLASRWEEEEEVVVVEEVEEEEKGRVVLQRSAAFGPWACACGMPEAVEGSRRRALWD